MAGRYPEAEESLRRAVAELRGGPDEALALDHLGEAQMEQGHYDDATRSYQAALHAHAGLTVNGEVRDDYWSLKAWALAEAGRTGEVAAAVENAIRFTNPRSRPGMSAMYHRLGMAMRAMGDERAAAGYFRQALDSEPEGRWGRLARVATMPPVRALAGAGLFARK